MFSQWAVDVLKRIIHGVEPKLRVAQPVRVMANVLFAVSVFFWFNRRPFASYSRAFWGQLLCLTQLFKVAYLLRFVMVELVYRQLRMFFCFVNPLITQLSVAKKWKADDSCLPKVINMTFGLLFICLNLLLAYGAEWTVRLACGWVRSANSWGRVRWSTPVTLAASKKRRKRQKSPKFRIRGPSNSSSETRCLFSFWPAGGRGLQNVHPSLRPSVTDASDTVSTAGMAGERPTGFYLNPNPYPNPNSERQTSFCPNPNPDSERPTAVNPHPNPDRDPDTQCSVSGRRTRSGRDY